MTEEKYQLLWLACKQFNMYLYNGSQSRVRYFKKPRHSWKQWIHVNRKLARDGIINRLARRRRIYYKLARYGLQKGLFGSLRYSRNAFFVPGGLLNVHGNFIFLRLYPQTELGFEWPEGVEQPYELRVYHKKGEWLADFRERHLNELSAANSWGHVASSTLQQDRPALAGANS
jgi:hypothetical protein